jgi:hypothetical protein
MLDSMPHEDRYTVLFHSVQMGLYPSAPLLIEKGADLHAAGYDYQSFTDPWNQEHTITSKYLHTITSRSMLTSEGFFQWRDLLQQANIDLTEFSKEAAQEDPLSTNGWNDKTLLKLFELDLSPKPSPTFHSGSCSRCHYGDSRGYLVEQSWMSLLERIRKAEDIAAPSNHSPDSYRGVEWICERCWYETRDELSENAGRLTLEIPCTAEDEDSHFLLSI